MTIGKKLILSVFSLFAMLLVLALSSLYSIHSLTESLHTTGAVTGRKSDLAWQIASDTNMIRANLRAIVLYTLVNEPELARTNSESYDKVYAQLQEIVVEIKPLLVNPKAREAVGLIESQLPKLSDAVNEIRRQLAAGKQKEAVSLLRNDVRATNDAIEAAAGVVVDVQKELRRRAEVDGTALGVRSQQVAWALVVFGALLAAFVLRVVYNLSRQLQRQATKLAEGASQIAAAAAQVAGSSQALAQGASEQAASLEETSASTEQITSMTRRNAENSHTAADRMAGVDKSIQDANVAIQAMAASMTDINASSDRISKIIRVIDEIAFQTNILALNAAVEAARAGEAGMGFAVVADEVRNLAQRCAQAAKDTAALIEESIARSAEGTAKATIVTGVIRTITDSAAKVKTLVDEVHLGSQEQTRGIEQIAKAVTQMDQVTQRTAANAEESASASEQLSAQAQAMNDIVTQLRSMVGGGGQNAPNLLIKDHLPSPSPTVERETSTRNFSHSTRP